MNISKAFNSLPIDSRKAMSNDIVTGLIAYNLGADYRRYFKRKANETIGIKRKLFNFIAGLNPEALDRFAEVLTGE